MSGERANKNNRRGSDRRRTWQRRCAIAAGQCGSAADLDGTDDGEATLLALIEAVRRQLTRSQQRAATARAERHAELRQRTFDNTRRATTFAWDASPVSTARLCAELWAEIRNEDWSLVSSYYSDAGGWPRKLWDFDKHYQWLGHAGGGGIGYGAPASVGAALANRDLGRLSFAIQTDGDMMYAPGVLWTAARYRIPLLSIMNNNRAYHMEIMHIQRICNARNRGIDRAQIGSEISDPNIDYAKLAARKVVQLSAARCTPGTAVIPVIRMKPRVSCTDPGSGPIPFPGVASTGTFDTPRHRCRRIQPPSCRRRNWRISMRSWKRNRSPVTSTKYRS